MILCLGTTPTVQRTMVFERLKLDAVNRASSVTESASGKSLNVARTLHTLGREVLATGFLGGDSGKLIRRDLDAAGIPCDFVEVGHRTRTCVTVIDRGTGVVTELVEETAPAEPAAYDALLALVADRIKRAEALVLSGSMPPGAPVDFYANCTRMARVAGVPVVLDGRGPALIHALPQQPSVVKPNRHELEETVGYPIDSDEKLKQAIGELLAKGPAWAAITMGAQGAVASDGRSFLRVYPPKVRAVNPIGSGDAFAAGLTLALLDHLSLAEACRLATACGTANALNTPPGNGRREDVFRLREQVHIEEM